MNKLLTFIFVIFFLPNIFSQSYNVKQYEDTLIIQGIIKEIIKINKDDIYNKKRNLLSIFKKKPELAYIHIMSFDNTHQYLVIYNIKKNQKSIEVGDSLNIKVTPLPPKCARGTIVNHNRLIIKEYYQYEIWVKYGLGWVCNVYFCPDFEK